MMSKLSISASCSISVLDILHILYAVACLRCAAKVLTNGYFWFQHLKDGRWQWWKGIWTGGKSKREKQSLGSFLLKMEPRDTWSSWKCGSLWQMPYNCKIQRRHDQPLNSPGEAPQNHENIFKKKKIKTFCCRNDLAPTITKPTARLKYICYVNVLPEVFYNNRNISHF